MKKLVYIFLFFTLPSCSSLMLQKRGGSTLRNYQVHELANGLNVLTIKDNSLPYLSLSAFVMDGYALDPQDQTGLTAAALNLLDKGYEGKSAEQISGEIEQMGAEYDVDVSADYSVIGLDGLAWQESKLLEIFSKLILKPDFSEKEIHRYKTKTIAEVKQRLDQIGYLASEIYDNEFYKNHPYGHRDIGTINDLKKMTRKDVLTQYQKVLLPQNTWIVAVGQFHDDFINRLDQTFSVWKSSSVTKVATYTPFPTLKGRDILLVNKPDAAQAEIRIGRPMISRQDPDYIQANVANTILGQGFSSRLMNTIRVKEGLTYSISSDLDMRTKGSGFKIKTFTKNESVGKTISEIYKVLDDFYKNGVTADELDTAKRYLVGKFPMLIETPEKLAFNIMILRLFGVSDDYLKNYAANISSVTLTEANGVIKKAFDPTNLKIVIVANKAKVLDQLKGLGNVTVVEASEYLK
jgi:zinc protease